jgi:hypothetical protein
MKSDSNSMAPEKEKAPWFKVAQVLFVAGLVVALYFLGLGMLHNRFEQGSRVDRYGHIKQ